LLRNKVLYTIFKVDFETSYFLASGIKSLEESMNIKKELKGAEYAIKAAMGGTIVEFDAVLSNSTGAPEQEVSVDSAEELEYEWAEKDPKCLHLLIDVLERYYREDGHCDGSSDVDDLAISSLSEKLLLVRNSLISYGVKKFPVAFWVYGYGTDAVVQTEVGVSIVYDNDALQELCGNAVWDVRPEYLEKRHDVLGDMLMQYMTAVKHPDEEVVQSDIDKAVSESFKATGSCYVM